MSTKQPAPEGGRSSGSAVQNIGSNPPSAGAVTQAGVLAENAAENFVQHNSLPPPSVGPPFAPLVQHDRASSPFFLYSPQRMLCSIHGDQDIQALHVRAMHPVDRRLESAYVYAPIRCSYGSTVVCVHPNSRLCHEPV